MNINNTFKNDIKKLVAEIEQRTACEVVPMIIKSSNHYKSANYACGFCFSVLATMALYFSPLHFINPIYYIGSQFLGFLLGYALANINLLKRLFISKKDFNYEVQLKAAEAFMHYNLHLTKDHNGVLIFISLFERKIKIICDKTVRDNIDNKIWDDIIVEFIDESKNKDVKEALTISLNHIGNVLENKFPNHSKNKKNELSDELILEI